MSREPYRIPATDEEAALAALAGASGGYAEANAAHRRRVLVAALVAVALIIPTIFVGVFARPALASSSPEPTARRAVESGWLPAPPVKQLDAPGERELGDEPPSCTPDGTLEGDPLVDPRDRARCSAAHPGIAMGRGHPID